MWGFLIREGVWGDGCLSLAGKGGEFDGGGTELLGVRADVGGVNGCGFVTDKLHRHALGDTASLKHGSDRGAEAVECLAVPRAAVPPCPFADKTDAVEADELGEFLGRIGVGVKTGMDVDGCFATNALGFFVSGACPGIEFVLHGLVELTGGFAGDDVNHTVLPVESVPAKVEDVAEALSVGAEAATDSG